MYWLAKRKLFWPAAMGGGPVVHPETGEQYIQTTQKGVDVGLALHLLKSYKRRGWRTLFLAAGDGDFSEVIEYLVEEENVDVYLIGSERSTSLELTQYVRGLIDIHEIADDVRFMPTGHVAAAPVEYVTEGEVTEVVVKAINPDTPYGFVLVPGKQDAFMRADENRRLVWPPNVGDKIVGRIVETFDMKKNQKSLKLVDARQVDEGSATVL